MASVYYNNVVFLAANARARSMMFCHSQCICAKAASCQASYAKTGTARLAGGGVRSNPAYHHGDEGQEALRAAEAERVALVVCDCGQDGVGPVVGVGGEQGVHVIDGLLASGRDGGVAGDGLRERRKLLERVVDDLFMRTREEQRVCDSVIRAV